MDDLVGSTRGGSGASTVILESAHGMNQGKAFGGRRAAPYRQAPLGPFAALIA